MINPIDLHNPWKQCSTQDIMSLPNFLLFHLRRHLKELTLCALSSVPNTEEQMETLTRLMHLPVKIHHGGS